MTTHASVSPTPADCICASGFGMNLSCPVHRPASPTPPSGIGGLLSNLESLHQTWSETGLMDDLERYRAARSAVESAFETLTTRLGQMTCARDVIAKQSVSDYMEHWESRCLKAEAAAAPVRESEETELPAGYDWGAIVHDNGDDEHARPLPEAPDRAPLDVLRCDECNVLTFDMSRVGETHDCIRAGMFERAEVASLPRRTHLTQGNDDAAWLHQFITDHDGDYLSSLTRQDEERLQRIAARLDAHGAPDLHRMLKTATVRLGILRDRMEGCDESSDDERTGHGLSLLEIPAWIEEQQAALDAHGAARETELRTLAEAVVTTMGVDYPQRAFYEALIALEAYFAAAPSPTSQKND